MRLLKSLTLILLCGLLYVGWQQYRPRETDWKSLTESQWRHRLTEEQYDILREGATEDAYTGALLDEHRKGVYRCAGCGLPLFSSKAKFDSGTGWPSFDDPIDGSAVTHRRQNTVLAVAVEVRCARCEGHLGHVFPDGPTRTGKRYCMNSASLKFKESGTNNQ